MSYVSYPVLRVAKAEEPAIRGRLPCSKYPHFINQTIPYYLYSIVRRRKPICGENRTIDLPAGGKLKPETLRAWLGEKTRMTVAKAKPARAARRSSGRPTKEQAGRIAEQIVDVATRLFLESSFEAVSVDLIAATARISKQTFYARFASKEALFAAVIRKGTNDLLLPAITESNRDGPIEATLIKIGVEFSKHALAPAAIAHERLITSEAHQFPQLASAYHENALHARGLIANVFSNAMRNGQIRSADASYLAEQFTYAVVDGPNRALVLTGKTAKSEKELRERISAAVRLFLDGCLPEGSRDRPPRRI
jgi:TetR/AcrR family transcriptional repressor of mexJK operon